MTKELNHWDQRIKTLMEQVGHPDSMSLYQAFKQLQNELTQLPAAQAAPMTDADLKRLEGAADFLPQTAPEAFLQNEIRVFVESAKSCAHGLKSCTDIIVRDKAEAQTAAHQPTKEQ